MSHFNKYKDTEIRLPDIRASIGGEWRLEAFKGVEFPRGSGIVFEFAGTRRVALDWFENIVTDIGLENYGDGDDGLTNCHVGTGTTPELSTDTELDVFVAGTGRIDQTAGAQATPPYYGHQTCKYRFSPNFGGGNVNLNEVGAGNTVTNGNLSSRALTVDSMGDPVTVSVLVDEYLDVFYKRRNYPAHLVEATGAPADLTGTIDIGGTSYGFTVRPHIVTTGGGSIGSGAQHGWGTGLGLGFDRTFGFNFHTSSRARAHDNLAALGPVTGALLGNTAGDTGGGLGTYTPNSYQRECFYVWDIDTANFVGGIGGVTVKTRLGAYQVLFDSTVPKVQGQAFTYYHNFMWDRHTTFIP